MSGNKERTKGTKIALRICGTVLSVGIFAAAIYVVITAGAVGFGFGQKVSGKVTDSFSSYHKRTGDTSTCFGYINYNGRHMTVEVDGGCGHVGESFTTHLPWDFSGQNYDRVYFSEGSARTKAIVAAVLGPIAGGFFALMAIFPDGGWRPKFKREDRSWVQGRGEPPASAKEADFRARGLSYRKGDGQHGEVLQEATGPYRGCSMFAMSETRWIGYQGTTYGDGGRESGPGTYRSMLRVCIDITPGFESESVIVYPLSERGQQEMVESPSKFDKFYRGIDALRSASLVCPAPFPTGNRAFDTTFGINCDSDLARRIMTPDLLSWIATDPRTAHFRIMVYGTELSACFLGPVGYQPDDIFDAAHIFPAADYLVDFVQRVPSQTFRPTPAAQAPAH